MQHSTELLLTHIDVLGLFLLSSHKAVMFN